jgi:hypothetical protein
MVAGGEGEGRKWGVGKGEGRGGRGERRERRERGLEEEGRKL